MGPTPHHLVGSVDLKGTLFPRGRVPREGHCVSEWRQGSGTYVRVCLTPTLSPPGVTTATGNVLDPPTTTRGVVGLRDLGCVSTTGAPSETSLVHLWGRKGRDGHCPGHTFGLQSCPVTRRDCSVREISGLLGCVYYVCSGDYCHSCQPPCTYEWYQSRNVFNGINYECRWTLYNHGSKVPILLVPGLSG